MKKERVERERKQSCRGEKAWSAGEVGKWMERSREERRYGVSVRKWIEAEGIGEGIECWRSTARALRKPCAYQPAAPHSHTQAPHAAAVRDPTPPPAHATPPPSPSLAPPLPRDQPPPPRDPAVDPGSPCAGSLASPRDPAAGSPCAAPAPRRPAPCPLRDRLCGRRSLPRPAAVVRLALPPPYTFDLPWFCKV
uniref:Uncharacterized protein n=1 Tax=Setaria viridis TaxID=4556 RepID=A0A4U6VK57_SETVI|nr:hypothetical protein SEVIR_3G363900v2 [Setaria viridis]